MAYRLGKAITSGMQLTPRLSKHPSQYLYSRLYSLQAAQKLAKEHKSISVAILERKDMQTLKMGALLSVAQGSAQPPKLITLEYRGAAKTQQPIVLVGKGITFDTGGNSLKSPANMIGMKYDMSGGATVSRCQSPLQPS